MSYQNSFSRALANDAKLGAYYTDLAHCESLSTFFEFGKETLVLEPAIGNAAAVKTVLHKEEDDGRYIFGVELNRDTYEECLRDDPLLEAVIQGDCIHDTRISNKVFTFVFSNPPYGDLEEASGKKRLEVAFLERIFTLHKKGGILVYVIPEYVLKDEKFIKQLIGRYEPIHTFRFRQPEYDKFKQVVFIGRARASYGWMPEWVETYKASIEELPELPESWDGEKITVPEGKRENVKMFTTLTFHPEDMLKYLEHNEPGKQFLADITRMECFSTTSAQPPVKLKQNHVYLMAVSGEGQGALGNEEEGTYHLQRGVAERVTKSSTIQKEGGDLRLLQSTSTAISEKIIQQDGTILTLE